MVFGKQHRVYKIWFILPVIFSLVSSQCDADFDLVFVVDSSGSIRDTNPDGVAESDPRDNYNLLKSFLSRIVDRLEISTSARTGVQIGIVTFGNRGRVELELTGDESAITNKIDNLPYQGGTTNTSGGLWKAKSVVLANEETNRPDVDDVILVITDGVATVDAHLTVEYARVLQGDGVSMFAVGFTEAAIEESVRELTSPNNDGEQVRGESYWLLPGFDALDEVVIGIARTICNIISDLCIPQPCLNGAVCENQSNDYTCHCADGYYGNICENDYCDPNPCVNGGACERIVNGYTCNCLSSYGGLNCEISFCVPNPCQNGGACVSDSSDYSCYCMDGYGGIDCEFDYCEPEPCNGNGECVRDPNGSHCNCFTDFGGLNCQINYCEPNPCMNGGRCRRSGNTYACDCLLGHGGTICQIDFCNPDPCLNNGACVRIIGSYQCNCQGLYFGDLCQYSATTEPESTTQPSTTQGPPVAGQSKSQSSSSDNGYLIALIVVIFLIVIGIIVLILLCCFWSSIVAYCRKKTERYVAPMKPLVVEKEEEYSTATTQCDIGEKHSEPVKKTYEQQVAIVPECPACKNPYESCVCCPICKRPDCDGNHHNEQHHHHHDSPYHHHHHPPAFPPPVPHVCHHMTDHMHAESSHVSPGTGFYGCPECQNATMNTRASHFMKDSETGSIRSSSQIIPAPAMLTYEEVHTSTLRRKKRQRRRRTRNRLSNGYSDVPPPYDTASQSSYAKYPAHAQPDRRQGFGNPVYGSDSDFVYVPSESRTPQRTRRAANHLNESFSSQKSRVSAGK